jgi:two-component system chemotaxis response regulator CheV
MEDKTLKVGSNELELVDFRLYKKEKNGNIYEGIYGINVAKVREIIKLPELTELPGSEDYIEGIFDLRGIVVPVIDLAKWMRINIPKNEAPIKKRVIITEFNNLLIGFIVHDAKRIRRISWADIEPAQFGVGHGNIDRSKITGITRIENGEILLILDLESIVEEMGFFEASLDEVELEDFEKFNGIVLLVDDSITARRIEKNALERMGFEVVEATNGEEGLQKLEELYTLYQDKIKDKVKLILSDVEMPRMDGYHMAARINEDNRFNKIPLIFSSSISDDFSDIRGKDVGAEGYLVKFDTNKFYSQIATILKNYKG